RRLAWALAAVCLLLALAAATLYAVFDQATVRAQLVEQFAARTGRTLTIDGDVGLSLWPELSVHLGALALSERDGTTPFARLDSARLAVAAAPLLSQRLVVRQVAIDGLALKLVRDRAGQFNIADLWSVPAAERLPDEKDVTSAAGVSGDALTIDVAGIALSQAQLSYVDQASGQQWQLSDLNLHTGRLQAQPAQQQFSVEQFALLARGAQDLARFNLQLDLPAVRLADGQLTIPQFALDAGWQTAARTVQATLNSPLRVDLAKQQLTLASLAGALQVDASGRSMKTIHLPIKGQLTVNWATPRADLQLASRFDESTLDLTLAVDRFTPLKLAFDLQVDRLDVDRYRQPVVDGQPAQATPGGAGEGALSAKAAGESASEAKIDLSALNGLDVSGRLRVGQMQVNKLQLAAVDLRLRAAQGRLDIAPLAAQLYGGHLSGQASVLAQGQRFTLQSQLQAVSIQPLLKDLLQKDPLSGRGRVSLDVQTRGDTVSALKQALAGQARIELRDGAINGFNVARRLREIKAGLTGGVSGEQGAVASEKTDFSELSASFQMAQGVAHNDDLLMKAPFLRLNGAGDIDLANSRIDYLARVSVVNTSTGQEGRELAHLNGLTIPLRLRGPFDRLSYSLALDQVLNDAARARFVASKEALKQKAVDQLGEQLKGWFGR
ncbi:MAG: AsmA family protein, partial [Dechloromonas sp.]|nr:AsmA family protein [Dechloromonas sp.]